MNFNTLATQETVQKTINSLKERNVETFVVQNKTEALGKIFKDKVEENELERFITFNGERVLLGVREHYVFLVFRILRIVLATFALAFLLALLPGLIS